MGERIDNPLTRYLDEQGVAYEVVEHGERFTAAAEARASGTEPEEAAKEVMLRRGEEYVLAVIPASERLDPKKAAELLGESGELRLATEQEMGADFAQFELGALPPLRPAPRGRADRRPAAPRPRAGALQRRRPPSLREAGPEGDGAAGRRPGGRPGRGLSGAERAAGGRSRAAGTLPG